MPKHVNIAPLECEISDATVSNGHFWRLRFTDPETGDTADITFEAAAFESFLSQMDAVRRKLGH